MFDRLRKLAKERGRAFGPKITNTFPVDVKRGELPDEMYMLRRSLLPLSLSMVLCWRRDSTVRYQFPTQVAEGLNIKRLFEALNQPITVVSTILKPGGYARFNQLASETEELLGREYTGIDVEKIIKLRDDTIAGWEHNKLYREKVASRKTPSDLPYVDCFKAPCGWMGLPNRAADTRIPQASGRREIRGGHRSHSQ